MTKDEQKQIARRICDSIRDKLCAQIDDGAMPADFDGFEIRWILEAMMADESVTRRDRFLAARKRTFQATMRRINSAQVRLGS